MLPRNLSPTDMQGSQPWFELGEGLPTLIGLATLASRACANLCEPVEPLSREAQSLLCCAKRRGLFEIRGNPSAFDGTERLLAVVVYPDESRSLVFRQRDNPRRTMEFLEGFRQLCQNGLVTHQLQKEFSLTSRGFQAAETLMLEDFQDEVEFAMETE